MANLRRGGATAVFVGRITPGLRIVTTEISYYNEDRPHQSLGLETPVPSRGQSDCEVLSRPVLNGLHHV